MVETALPLVDPFLVFGITNSIYLWPDRVKSLLDLFNVLYIYAVDKSSVVNQGRPCWCVGLGRRTTVLWRVPVFAKFALTWCSTKRIEASQSERETGTYLTRPIHVDTTLSFTPYVIFLGISLRAVGLSSFPDNFLHLAFDLAATRV